MTTCCEVDGTFSVLELPSPTFPFIFACVIIILCVQPPLIVLLVKGLNDGVALIVPRDGVD
jgi:hypothetical protein